MTEIDLNLLRVFDILYEEGNVTRAAARLFLTQSAVSHALARLRDVLGDPLFVRIPSGLQPTVRAHQLAPRLRVSLAEIRNAVAPSMFDPAKTRRRFTISAGTYFSRVIVPNLIAIVRKSAPGITLQITNLSANLGQALDQQQVDIALGGYDRVPARFRSEVLLRDEVSWVIGAHHPLAQQPFDHDAFLNQPRIALGIALATDGSREPPARDDLVLRTILETDDEAVLPPSVRQASAPTMVYDPATALAVTAATDMVTLLPRRYAEACAGSKQVKIIDFPPDHAQTIELSMLWHSRAHDDPGLVWLRALIHEAVAQSCDTAGLRDPVHGTGASGDAAKKTKKVSARGRRAKAPLSNGLADRA